MHKLFLNLLILILLSSCSNKQSTDQESDAANAESSTRSAPTLPELPRPIMPDKVLNAGFLVLDSVYNSELMAPYDIFQHTIFHGVPGIRVFTVAKDTGVLTTFEGLRMLPDYEFSNCPPIDILVVPSALHNMSSDLEDEAVISFVKEKGGAAQYLLSLCDGAFILAQAGLLDSLHATTFPGDIAPFRKRFPQIKVHEGLSFVQHGKAITSAGGAVSYDAAMYLVEFLYGKKVAEGVGKGMVIDWDLNKIDHFRKF